ncbi:MAG TPA: hypothetical protein VGE21_17100 [Flavobacteriales bacterium]
MSNPFPVASAVPVVRALLVLVTCASALVAYAQVEHNRVRRWVLLDRDTVQVDTLSIAPGSFVLLHDSVPVDPSTYTLEPYSGRLIRKAGAPKDTLLAIYRTLPLLLAGPYRHKDPERLIRPPGPAEDPFRYVAGAGRQDPLGISGLNKSGSISRGILFGNAQDLSVNSALNLELSGRLTDRISVLASVTDNNIPIQAGGNTAELQDFDQVFIKLFDDRQELIAGDFVLQRPKSWFLTYFKKTKGVGYSTRLGDTKGVHGNLAVSAAISKGKFSRQLIQGIEGVQGPYRLTAAEGGTFIIVLSGTERVYVDGQLLTRGLENDYVIDYNTAELTFTAKRLITKDRRIVVEFQYSDKNYARSLMRLAHDLQLGSTTLRLDLYSEQDHRNQSLQQTLTDTDRQALAEAGDDPLGAVVPGVDSVGYNADEVLYARIDSLGYAPVYRYSTAQDSARFRVSFSNVGPGLGDYVQQEFTASGRVFRWVAPDTVNGLIVHRGTHLPVRVLVAPKAQRVLALGVEHRFSARTRTWGEVALSDNDRNTFSSRDGSDDQGAAVRAGAVHLLPLSRADTTLRLVLGTDNEWRGKDFSVVERYRAVEFERNWNALLVPQDGDQLLASASVGLQAGKRGTADVSSSVFRIQDRYEGFRHMLRSDLHPGRFDVVGEASALNAMAGDVASSFVRHRSRIQHRFKAITVGFRDEHEHNRFRSDSLSALISGSYRFYDWEAFVQSPDSARVRYRVGGGQRYEEAWRNGVLVPSTEATTYNTTFDLGRAKVRKLASTFTYRRLRIIDTTLTVQRPEDTWLARLEHGHSALKGILSWDLFYEFGSGLEQRREFIYVQVPAGQGVYVWRDYNGNGLKELNEFEQAPFGYEADHIRAYVQTNDYVRTYSNQLSMSGELRPGAVWAQAKGLKGFLGRWSDQASFRTDRRTGNDDIGYALNPLRVDPLDTSLVAFAASARNTVYYDRSSRTWSIDHTWQSDRNKSLLLNGFEARVKESNIVHVRWNTTTRWVLEVEGEVGRVANSSDLLEGRTYSIEQRGGKPKLTWQPSTSMRAVAQFKYTEKDNSTELGGEQALIRDLGLEFRLNTAGKGALQLNANVVDIAYDGVVDSSLGTEMLAGLKPGTNLTWTLTLQRRLSDNLQVDITYNGRRSEGVPAIHVGGAQVRAYF